MNKIIDKIIADEASLESPEPFTSFGMAMVSLKRRIARRAYIAGLEAAKASIMRRIYRMHPAQYETPYQHALTDAAHDINTLIAAAKEGA